MFVETKNWRGRLDTVELEIYKGHDNRTMFGMWSGTSEEGLAVALLPDDLDRLIGMLTEWQKNEETSLVEGKD